MIKSVKGLKSVVILARKWNDA